MRTFGKAEILANVSLCFSFTKRVAEATYACRIRRDNDNAETDIILPNSGACDINSNVSTGGTLAAWIGSNNGYMVTDYDQSSNGLDMTQSNNSQQARIVTAGIWNGYKDYTVGNCVYLSSGALNDSIGSAYIKHDKVTNQVLYFLSQAKASGLGNNYLLSLSVQFDSPNNKSRILDFTPTVNQIVGDTAMISGINKTMYQSDGANYKVRINGVNQTNTIVSGTETGNWFNFYSGDSRTLQKGALLSSYGNLYRNYKEYEILVFNVVHNDTESIAIESLM